MKESKVEMFQNVLIDNLRSQPKFFLPKPLDVSNGLKVYIKSLWDITNSLMDQIKLYSSDIFHVTSVNEYCNWLNPLLAEEHRFTLSEDLAMIKLRATWLSGISYVCKQYLNYPTDDNLIRIVQACQEIYSLLKWELEHVGFDIVEPGIQAANRYSK